MSARERFFINFCLRPRLKYLAYGLALLLAAIVGSWAALILLFLPLLADVYGAHLITIFHPSLTEDLEEHLTAGCLQACGIHYGEHHYVFTEEEGSIEHWRTHHLPDTLKLTVLTPKRDYAVMASRQGRIFPPIKYAPPAFSIKDLGCVELYYRDIQLVELADGIMRLHTGGGAVHEFPAGGGGANDAALYLRQRLRDYKALDRD